MTAPSCSSDPPLPNAELIARAEKAYRTCMAEHGIEVTQIRALPGDYDIQIAPGDYSDEEAIAAITACERMVEKIFDEGYVFEDPFGDLEREAVTIEMRDGVRLAATLFRPAGDGPWPTVVFRTPYDRTTDSLDVRAYLNAGVAVLSQDLRGRFASEGVDQVFTTDGDGMLQDGYDTLAWVTQQNWSNGLIASEGISGSGIPVYLQLAAQPPGLRAAWVNVATANLYDSLFRGGVFREALVVRWLEDQQSLHFLDALYAHPYEDDFWDPLQTKDAYPAADIPVLHVSGWYDIFAQATLDAFLGYQLEGGEGARGKQKLVMGPWVHGNLGVNREQGDLVYPENSREPPISRASVHSALFTEALGLKRPLHPEAPALDADGIPAVQYYVMGDVDDPTAPGNAWRSADAWPPPATTQRLYLQPGGELAAQCPDSGKTSYTFDPEDPSPTLCGANLYLNAGPCDQRKLESRADTAVFSTAPLPAPLEITGRLWAHLFVDIDQVDADLMVRISDVYPDGRSMLVTEGAARMAARGRTKGLSLIGPGEVVETVVDLLSTSIILNTGHRLRVAITSSSYPRYRVNPGSGFDFGAFDESPLNKIRVRLHHEQGAASYLEVPTAGEQDTAVTCP